MKVAILGASGIIGQHLMISVPQFIQPVFTNREGPPVFTRLEVWNRLTITHFLDGYQPRVVVNLLGQNNPDVVERDPEACGVINVSVVRWIAEWCDKNGAHLVQVSSQAVLDPVNFYGRQKAAAEKALREQYRNWTVLRPTFVLGIRPFPAIGRENPAERMLSGLETRSVCNRFFSVSFAWDVAKAIWLVVQKPLPGITMEVGNPETMSRYDVAYALGADPESIVHEALEGLAARPVDTTYHSAWMETALSDGFERLKTEYRLRSEDGLWRKAAELAAFLCVRHEDALAKLNTGFGPLHNKVTEDFRRAFPSGVPPSHEALLGWYRKTEAYLWELTAYHCDAGFNYSGMLRGIVERLNAGKDSTQYAASSVLCLGDGTGDLTLACNAAGLLPVYNDLGGSKIAAFAQNRFAMRGGAKIQVDCGMDFEPLQGGYGLFDAVVSLDFLEHVPNVREWVSAIHRWLKPQGLFCAQNAFGLGSGPDGPIPMHLQENDQWVENWDPMLKEVGFEQLSSNWYRKL